MLVDLGNQPVDQLTPQPLSSHEQGEGVAPRLTDAHRRGERVDAVFEPQQGIAPFALGPFERRGIDLDQQAGVQFLDELGRLFEGGGITGGRVRPCGRGVLPGVQLDFENEGKQPDGVSLSQQPLLSRPQGGPRQFAAIRPQGQHAPRRLIAGQHEGAVGDEGAVQHEAVAVVAADGDLRARDHGSRPFAPQDVVVPKSHERHRGMKRDETGKDPWKDAWTRRLDQVAGVGTAGTAAGANGCGPGAAVAGVRAGPVGVPVGPAACRGSARADGFTRSVWGKIARTFPPCTPLMAWCSASVASSKPLPSWRNRPATVMSRSPWELAALA